MAFSRPASPAAKCLHLVRLGELTSRSELIEATGLSQPTITRAVTALVGAGYVTERMDLAKSNGRGRPTIPLELADPEAVHAGVSIGTESTYIALFDVKGRTLTCVDAELPVAKLDQDDFIQHIMAGLNRLTAAIGRPLATVGVTASGTVTDDGRVTAPNLGWNNVPFGPQLREQFSVPVLVTSVSAAIVGSELQSSRDLTIPSTLALFADDSIACAVTTPDGVEPVEVSRDDLTTQGLLDSIGDSSVRTLHDAVTNARVQNAARPALDRRARGLGQLVGELCETYQPATVVVAGSAFIDDPLAPAPFAQAVRETVGKNLDLRLLPTHREMVRDIARAAALDLVLRDPLSVAAP
ncbi:ROK family transcriptional regulator [Corynebacterium sp. TA-R-1]|uniref:ROK family transcriptional regulator n=1 Tax=Corynebacterium stercoris TaxID=2943490 RepID=A0ABT1G4Y3_9CORY|nr:ROK family transcriptional regulator [Corynebacterium stercoris]MCP1388123.1 ROK family transcriptional regulator [Corynebacterium stercoris]